MDTEWGDRGAANRSLCRCLSRSVWNTLIIPYLPGFVLASGGVEPVDAGVVDGRAYGRRAMPHRVPIENGGARCRVWVRAVDVRSLLVR